MNPQTLPLKAIHVPDAIGWWPPAPGWWILVVLSMLMLWGLIRAWRWLRRATVKKQALRLLNELENNVELSSQQKLQALSRLLRRVSISRFPRQEVAGLNGEAWLIFLDQQWDRQGFSSGEGRCLLDAPYQAESGIDVEPLFVLCRDWIKSLPRES